MKHTAKIITIIMLLTACLFIFAGCETKMGNRITGGRDVQTFTYAYVILGGQKVAEGAVTQ